MSMGHKPCPYCNACEAEALIAVDGLIEWFCIGCLAEWTEEPEPITGKQWDDNEQRYL